VSEDDATARRDAELEVMRQIDSALRTLDRPGLSRVLRWACDRYGVTLPAAEGER
jgi:hypothetical protein